MPNIYRICRYMIDCAPFATAVDAFLGRCDEYRRRRAMSEARLSTLLFNHGARLAQIRVSGNAGTKALDRALVRLADLEAALPAEASQ